jgi:dTDP-4-amino-4,6-dideoxygalactose transaminase
MKVKFLDLNKQYLSIKNEMNEKLLNEIQNAQFINGQTKSIFEENFSKYIGTKYCLGVANGTDALEIAIKALNLPEESEVIIQANTFIATCLGASYNKLKIIFADVDYNSMMLDLDDVENKITNNTKLIIVVHLYGQSCNMERLTNICKKNNLYLLEDCAQSHGALYDGKKLGTFGDISTFSFYPGKNLGAYGDGGAICTNNCDYYTFMKKYSNLGSIIKYNHEFIGRNSRLDTIQSSILDVKLKYLDIWNQKRREKAELYKKLLSDCKEITINQVENLCIPVYHLFIIKVKNNREKLMDFLKEKGIDTIIHYPIPCHKTQAYKEYNNLTIKNTDLLSGEILSLPIYAELKDEEIEYICQNIINFFN